MSIQKRITCLINIIIAKIYKKIAYNNWLITNKPVKKQFHNTLNILCIYFISYFILVCYIYVYIYYIYIQLYKYIYIYICILYIHTIIYIYIYMYIFTYSKA